MTSDPTQSTYAQNAARLVPGFDDLRRIAAVVLSERLGPEAEVLILGVGGGLELDAFARHAAGWRFTGIDPDPAMLALAAAAAAPFEDRVTLIEGKIDAAPNGPFDGATALLLLHFLTREERLATLRGLRARLRTGAPLVVAHHSVPDGEARALWLARFAAFATMKGFDAHAARAAAAGIGDRLPMLTPAEDEALLAEAGFDGIETVYAGLTLRGWRALASPADP